MKKIIIFSFVLLVLLQNCAKEETIIAPPTPIGLLVPIASFTVSSTDEGIATFTNTSKYAETFEWDFGDNAGKSTEKNPTYQFKKTDKYVVTLNATGAGGKNSIQSSTEIKLVQRDIAEFDNKVADFMAKNNLSGITLAVSVGGKLVYQKGYGIANKETGEKVNTDHRFRVGSMSKTVTAIAILKLVQDGKLKLEDKVFGAGSVFENTYGTKTYAEDLKNITVRHLLNHTAGGWGSAENEGDYFQLIPNASNKDFLTATIDKYPLINKPGTKYSYSNFGYFLLSRIIEKVSSKSYLNYLNEELFKDIGLQNKIEIAGMSKTTLKKNEVSYYGQTALESSFIYGTDLNRRDGAGGLIFTPADYLRVINAIDGFASRPDILNANSLAEISKMPANVQTNYAAGMQLYSGNYWSHSGSINCQFGQWWRTPNEINVAVITNSRIDAYGSNFNQFSTDFLNFAAFFYQNVPKVKLQNFDQF